MAIKPGLRVSQTQQLALTPELRQSIKVLAMSAGELETLVADEVEQNPLLKQDFKQETTYNTAYEFALDTAESQLSVAENLRQQITVLSTPGKLQQVAIYIAGNLTDQGFIDQPDKELAQELGVSSVFIQQAVALLQACQPTGIGARNLRECLELQLKATSETVDSQQVLLENLTQFAEANWPGLRRKTGRSTSELHRLGAVLLNLNPNPANEISPKEHHETRPDIQVSRDQEGGFSVELIGSSAPTLRIDRQLFERSLAADPLATEYLKSNLSSANTLRRAIELRSKTVLRVAQKIVEFQHRFFVDGPKYLRPQTQAALAAELDLHPSTMSRAIANKSLLCPLGLFPLKFFFTSSLNSVNSDAGTSSHVVQNQILQLTNAETCDDILSDERIAALLRNSGVDIARRTVAKYRQCLNIPTSAQRRRSKRIL